MFESIIAKIIPYKSLIIIGVTALALGAGYTYMNYLWSSIDTLESKVLTLQSANEKNLNTITELQRQQKQQAALNTQLETSLRQSRIEVDTFKRNLSEAFVRDGLADNPAEAERAVNEFTDKIFRDFESDTGRGVRPYPDNTN